MKTIYVGMALSGAPDDFREDFQHELKVSLRQLPNVQVLDFFGPLMVEKRVEI